MNLNYHNFHERLLDSEKPSNYITYLTAVNHWWPEAVAWERVTDLEQQKQGKDVVVTLPGGKNVILQFKMRGWDYGDVLIEYRHDFDSGRQKPGWIEEPSAADYLIYCTPTKIYRIDYETLHMFWGWSKNNLIEKYDLAPARNKTYVTRNVGVPLSVFWGWVDIDELERRSDL